MKQKPILTGFFASPWVMLFFMLALLSSCTWLVAPPVDEQAARQLIGTLAAQNADLNQFKGLLNLKVEEKGRTLAGRAAWAAVIPNRLRVEWLNMMGQPIASLAGDGRTLTYRIHGDDTIHRLRQSRDVLDKIIHIPIGVDDMVTLLAGRPLLPSYAVAREMPSEGDGRVIVLKNRWHRTVACFWLNGSDELHEQETYNADGTLRYRLVWNDWNKRGAFVVPKRILVESGTGGKVALSIQRFWPNVPIAPSSFVIKSPVESDM
jgi:outer membrane biogenesis lipoprotein LolB